MKEQKFDINQKVWILQWNFVDGQDRRTVDMPYKIAERRIVGVHGQADWDENGNTMRELAQHRNLMIWMVVSLGCK